MTPEQRQVIITLYKKGIDLFSIRKRTRNKLSEIKKVIDDYSNEKKYFNVNQFDCWLMPTKH